LDLYVESSAVLAWLLGEKGGSLVRRALAGARTIISSDLTILECERVLIRAAFLGDLSEAAAANLGARLAAAAGAWNILRLAPDIIDRARKPFPAEPIRTLDALHVASALYARSAVPDLEILSLDERIRRVANALGIAVRPD
jgi:predicted nucleic acid-binding protein